MRIVFDQGVPRRLRTALPKHTVQTADELGWSQLSDAELLTRASAQFDALISTDQSLKHQQNLANFNIAILVLPRANWRLLQRRLSEITRTIDALQPKQYRELPR